MAPRLSDNPTWERDQRRGKIAGGLLVFGAGALLLLREMGQPIPWWLFSWKTLLIGIGLVMGIKHSFRRAFWMVPVLVGSANLFLDFYPETFNRHILWPVVLMILGLVLVFKPFRNRRKRDAFRPWEQNPVVNQAFSATDENKGGSTGSGSPVLEINSVMGGVEKRITTKELQKCEINVVMAGAQVDFSQADFKKQAYLEINAVMGGIALVVPANWEIRSELNCVFGGVEDKRNVVSDASEPNLKTLVLEGNVFMGGIEIRTF